METLDGQPFPSHPSKKLPLQSPKTLQNHVLAAPLASLTFPKPGQTQSSCQQVP